MFCEGGHFTLVPNIIRQIFGDKATQLYGILFSYTGISALILILLQKLFLNSDTYGLFFITGSVLSVFSLILLICVFDDKKFVNNVSEETNIEESRHTVISNL